MKKFDILLVVGYFRSVTAYLSIIRHLGSDLRIGVLPIPVEPSLISKTGVTGDLFMRLCSDFGAQSVNYGDSASTRLMIIQQFPYSDSTVSTIRECVDSDRNIGFMTLAMAGIEQHDKFIQQFGIDKVYTPSRRFTEFLLQKRQAVERYAGVRLVEVGLPYAKYPVFPDFKVDWIIAAPTLFSFSDEKCKHRFLGAVLNILNDVPDNCIVAYKPHNGNALDYFTPRVHYILARLIYRVPKAYAFLDGIAHYLPRAAGRHLEKIQTGILHLSVLRRVKRMSDISPYSDLAIEAFLPGVQKGVIGGLSNTIWGALYFGIPFFNCVDPALRKNGMRLSGRKSDNLLDLNLQYFGVEYCHGDIRRGEYGESIVTYDDRKGDLLSEIRNDLSVQQC